MHFTQLNHVALHVADVERSVAFYRDVLQLKPISRPAFTFPGAWFQLGVDQELHLIGERTKEVISHNRGNHFALLVDDFDAWEKYLIDRQVNFAPRRTRPDGALQLYVIDPDGHYVELCTLANVGQARVPARKLGRPEARPTTMPDFLPTASLDMLRRRAELLKAVRRFFDERGFLEVETPLLSHDTVIDRHLDPLPVTVFTEPRQPDRGNKMWLQTSPEFGMKRLLAAGATAIYQITKAFRGGHESGPEHNPEFTIVEWYRVGDDYEAGMQLLDDLAASIFACGAAERLTYRDAFLRHVGFDPHLPEAKLPLPMGLPKDADRHMILDDYLTSLIAPYLGKDRPTILYDYPASQAALARIRDGEVPVAERFELYFRGLELANGYHELLDPAELRKRNRENNNERFADDKYLLPEDSRLLAAMDHGLPACSGCALGFDRLVMAATGAKSLHEVMAFPIDRA